MPLAGCCSFPVGGAIWQVYCRRGRGRHWQISLLCFFKLLCTALFSTARCSSSRNSLRGITHSPTHPVHILVAVLPPALMVFFYKKYASHCIPLPSYIYMTMFDNSVWLNFFQWKPLDYSSHVLVRESKKKLDEIIIKNEKEKKDKRALIVS